MASKPEGPKVIEWLQPRNGAPYGSRCTGYRGKADPVITRGRPMRLREETGTCTADAHRGRGPSTQGQICGLTSGRANCQQGLVATCKDPSKERQLSSAGGIWSGA